MQWKKKMNLHSTKGMIDSTNVREPATKFILDYMSKNPEWKQKLVELNNHSHARAVFMVKNDLMKESVPMLILSGILEDILE